MWFIQFCLKIVYCPKPFPLTLWISIEFQLFKFPNTYNNRFPSFIQIHIWTGYVHSQIVSHWNNEILHKRVHFWLLQWRILLTFDLKVKSFLLEKEVHTSVTLTMKASRATLIDWLALTWDHHIPPLPGFNSFLSPCYSEDHLLKRQKRCWLSHWSSWFNYHLWNMYISNSTFCHFHILEQPDVQFLNHIISVTWLYISRN